MTYHEERMANIPNLDNDSLVNKFKFSMLHSKVLTEVEQRHEDKPSSTGTNLTLDQITTAIRLTKEYVDALELEIRKRMKDL